MVATVSVIKKKRSHPLWTTIRTTDYKWMLWHWTNGIRQIIHFIGTHCYTVKLISNYWATRPRVPCTPPFTDSSLNPLNLLHSSNQYLPWLLPTPAFPNPPLPPLHVTVSCFCSAQKQKLLTLVCKKLAAGDNRKKSLRWVLVGFSHSLYWQYESLAAATTKYRYLLELQL